MPEVASFLGAIFNANVPFVPTPVASVAIILISAYIALVGYKGLSAVGRAAVPLLWVLALFALWRVADAAGGLGAAVAFFIKGGIPALQGLIAAGVIYAVLELIYERVLAREAESARFANP